jgi:hypothetical protein
MNIPVILKELAKVGVVALTEKSVEAFVETKIRPIFENWGKEESRAIELEECLSEYLLRCYGKNNIMTTIVFGRLQKTLEDLYIPLTLEEYRNEDAKWVIDENCYNILDNYSRILIVDMAGMGKSTIVKYFACQGVNLDKCIPIVIELRRLEKNQSILEYIQTQINSLDKNIRIEEIVDILKKGDFVIFFDGYDEIANENKSVILDAIQEFTSKATNTKIVITSREEDDLNSLGEYRCVNIKPLTEEEAYELIKKYDNDGDISKKLVKRLKEDSSMDVLKEFLENPLLVSLLYKTFEYKEEIPYKKMDFYEQVYAALFNDHDKTKGSAYVHEKRTKLDKFQFEQILRAFGFLCLKVDKVEYSSQLIHELLAKAIDRFSWLKINVDDFLYDITHAVPFIQIDGNEYKWVHKTFMEYFASCFICYDNKVREEEYFNKMVYTNSGINYYNILSFCCDMDVLGFRKYAIMPYLKKFIEKSEHLKEEGILRDSFKNENLLIQLLAYEVEVWFMKASWKISDANVENRLSESVAKFRDEIENDANLSMTISEDSGHIYLFIYKEINRDIYRIISDKFPEIVEQIDFDKNFDLDVSMDVEYSFKDIMDNFTKDVSFFKIAKRIFYVLFQTDRILICDKCKKIVKEIERENSLSNTNIFDL